MDSYLKATRRNELKCSKKAETEVLINSKEAYKLYMYKVSLKHENGILYLIIKAGL